MPGTGLALNGDALRVIRERTGLSGTQLAKQVGIDRAYLAHIEANRRRPSPEVAQRITQVLKCSLAALLADPDKASA